MRVWVWLWGRFMWVKRLCGAERVLISRVKTEPAPLSSLNAAQINFMRDNEIILIQDHAIEYKANI